MRHTSYTLTHGSRRFGRGLGAIAALVILVLLSGFAAAVVRLGWSAQMGISQDMLGARALRAANAGADWGLYRALHGACAGANQTLDLRSDTGFRVTVTCSSSTYNEGQARNEALDTTTAQTVTVYTISAVACNGSSGSCPDNTAAAGATYVERERLVHATDTSSP